MSTTKRIEVDIHAHGDAANGDVVRFRRMGGPNGEGNTVRIVLPGGHAADVLPEDLAKAVESLRCYGPV